MTDIKNYTMVSSKAALKRAIRAAGKSCALDFETTSLRPDTGRVRLVSLCSGNIQVLVDFDKIKGGFSACAKMFCTDTEWVVFNVGFEGRWFLHEGAKPTLSDVGILRRAKMGGGRFSLATMVKWDLDITMDKTEQAGNWGRKVLTQEQLDYAYLDADLTWRLWLKWSRNATENHWMGHYMLNDMWSAVIEMEDTGMLIDIPAHKKLVKNWTRVQRKQEKMVRAIVGLDEVKNINSDKQWSDFFARILPDHFLKGWARTEKAGQLSMKNVDLKLMAGLAGGEGPLADVMFALAGYKTISKYLSSFGETLIDFAERDGTRRIHPTFHVAAAKTGRYSSSKPNAQQIPRDRELLGSATSVRLSFISGYGLRLVTYDFSGIELRTLALVSGDVQLLEDCLYGDVHLEVAQLVAGRELDKSTETGKALRQAAKAISFGIIYGISSWGLSATMKTSEGQAQGMIDAWASRYPKAFDFRHDQMDEAKATGYVQCVGGGSIYMTKKPRLTRCANYGIQRAALAVMARSIIRHKNTLDEERSAGRQQRTKMIATIHDALIDETATRDAKRCLKLMKNDMEQGYLDVFPGAPLDRLVEGGTGANWHRLD